MALKFRIPFDLQKENLTSYDVFDHTKRTSPKISLFASVSHEVFQLFEIIGTPYIFGRYKKQEINY